MGNRHEAVPKDNPLIWMVVSVGESIQNFQMRVLGLLSDSFDGCKWISEGVTFVVIITHLKRFR